MHGFLPKTHTLVRWKLDLIVVADVDADCQVVLHKIYKLCTPLTGQTKQFFNTTEYLHLAVVLCSETGHQAEIGWNRSSPNFGQTQSQVPQRAIGIWNWKLEVISLNLNSQKTWYIIHMWFLVRSISGHPFWALWLWQPCNLNLIYVSWNQD